MCSAGPATKAAIAPETAVAVETPIRDQEGRLLPLAQPLKVCLMSADFPGLPNAGHISTAFTLLAAALGTDPSLKVSLPPLKLMKQRHHGQVSTGLFRARPSIRCPQQHVHAWSHLPHYAQAHMLGASQW